MRIMGPDFLLSEKKSFKYRKGIGLVDVSMWINDF